MGMPRLIDAKVLERQIKATFKDSNPVLMGQMLRWVRCQTTIDAVPVVRCNDCKHNNMNGGDCNGIITMHHYDTVLELNVAEYIKLEHCSYGERKDNGQT